MYYDGWQANMTDEDVTATVTKYGATDVVTTTGREHPETTWRSYVDTDEDLVDTFSIMVWYADRTDDQISEMRQRLAALLADYPPPRR
jgi:hypothetical protein